MITTGFCAFEMFGPLFTRGSQGSGVVALLASDTREGDRDFLKLCEMDISVIICQAQYDESDFQTESKLTINNFKSTDKDTLKRCLIYNLMRSNACSASCVSSILPFSVVAVTLKCRSLLLYTKHTCCLCNAL